MLNLLGSAKAVLRSFKLHWWIPDDANRTLKNCENSYGPAALGNAIRLALLSRGIGTLLDISRMGFDDAFAAALKPNLTSFQNMAALEAGATPIPTKTAGGPLLAAKPDLAPTPELKQEIAKHLTSRSICQ